MTVAKITEITAQSQDSFEDAIKSGLARASKTLEGIRGAWIKEQKVIVEDGAIKAYRVDMKISFVLND
jgi:dodecin